MKTFDDFIKQGDVREQTPNPEQAESLFKKGVKRLEYAKDRDVTEDNADLVLEDAYEAVREAIDSFLLKAGYNSYSHKASIVYSRENLNLTEGETNKVDKARRLRNDSKYRGEDVTVTEAEETIELAERTMRKLKDQRR